MSEPTKTDRGLPTTGLCLVTGATGFVGAAVARVLLNTGHQVRVLARPQSDRRNLQNLSVEIADGALEDPASLAAAVAGCRYLFHVAADYRLWVPDPAASAACISSLVPSTLMRNIASGSGTHSR